MAIDLKLIDQLLAGYKKPEDIIGENGLLKQLTKALLERALSAELTVSFRQACVGSGWVIPPGNRSAQNPAHRGAADLQTAGDF